MAWKTEAIILKERQWRSADRWYDILTPQEGRLRVLLKSAGRSRSKLAGQLMPLNRVRLMLGRGRQDHVAGADILDSQTGLRQDLKTLILAEAVAELVLKVNVAGQAAGQEFRLVQTALALLNDTHLTEADKVAVVRIFLWKMLAAAGWTAELEQCAICGRSLEQSAMGYLAGRGFVCLDHQPTVLALTPALASFIKFLLKTDDWRLILAARGGLAGQEVWGSLSQMYYQDIIEEPLHSLTVLKLINV